jgi:predicted ATPase
MKRLKTIELDHWKRFESVSINFHPRLTVLTGVNGSGKSTILNLLARTLGWAIPEMSTTYALPILYKENAKTRYFRGATVGSCNIGRLTYSDGNKVELNIREHNSPTLEIEMEGLPEHPEYDGIFIPASRQVFTYASVGWQQGSDLKSLNDTLLESKDANQQWLYGQKHINMASSIKQTLLSWATNGYGNVAVEADVEQLKYFEGFQNVLKHLLPKEMHFISIMFRKDELILRSEAKADDYLLEASSGGITNVISLAWQVYLSSITHPDGFMVVIDEVENQLHAGLQRSILPNLLAAFPTAQFIVSTHSPLIVGSVEDSNVYALTVEHNGSVVSRLVDSGDKSQTASEILQDVLGVPFTMPVWVESKLDAITEKYTRSELTADMADQLREELKQNGLVEYAPTTLVNVVDRLHDKNK